MIFHRPGICCNNCNNAVTNVVSVAIPVDYCYAELFVVKLALVVVSCPAPPPRGCKNSLMIRRGGCVRLASDRLNPKFKSKLQLELVSVVPLGLGPGNEAIDAYVQ